MINISISKARNDNKQSHSAVITPTFNAIESIHKHPSTSSNHLIAIAARQSAIEGFQLMRTSSNAL
jgi:hypothetical protein